MNEDGFIVKMLQNKRKKTHAIIYYSQIAKSFANKLIPNKFWVYGEFQFQPDDGTRRRLP